MPLWAWIMLGTTLVCAFVLINRASRLRRRSRCPWTTPILRHPCLKRVGHDGMCKIRDQFGAASYWLGINYRKNGDL